MQNKIWLSKEIPENEIEKLSSSAHISKLLAKIFISRGVSDPQYVRNFLNPKMDDLHDPFLLNDMGKAVNRILAAIDNKEKILIYGDYDVDGITGTSLLTDFLKYIGANVIFFVPDRLEDGYGLSMNSSDKVLSMSVSLLITVDCGITSVNEVNYLKSKSDIQIIITDHHECLEILPEAYAVINPHRSDSTYPFKSLAGVGVAFKLVQAICIRKQMGDYYKKYLDIVALGTVADIVPLLDENRIIVKYGIQTIMNSKNHGIKALLDVSGYGDKPLNTYGISFGLAPRVNAAGRMGDATRAINLFTKANQIEAKAIAEELDNENKIRQETERNIVEQVVFKIEEDPENANKRIIVVSGRGWHHGIIGIVASKITERYHKPCLLLSEENGLCKGSGRSVPGFNLFKALVNGKDFLQKFGGHEMAVGLQLKSENLELFKKNINDYAILNLKDEDLVAKIKVDTFVSKEEITLDNVKDLDLLAPFGAGNPGPVFAYEGFKINDLKTVGDGKHLKMRLNMSGFNFDAIGFNMGELEKKYSYSDIINSVFSLELNVWNNSVKVQLNLKDIKPYKCVVID